MSTPPPGPPGPPPPPPGDAGQDAPFASPFASPSGRRPPPPGPAAGGYPAEPGTGRAAGPPRPPGPPPSAGQPGPPVQRAPGAYDDQAPYYAPGWKATVEQTRPPRRRRPLLVTLLVLGGLLAVAVLVVVGVAVVRGMDSRPLGEVDSAVTVASRRLQPGHCVSRLPADGDVSRVEVVPCDEPHEAEVVGSLEISGDEWPGKDRVERQAVDYCEMDSAEAEAGFRPVVWTPTRDGWGQGDRSALCLAWRETGPVTGSFTAGDEVAPS